LQILYSQTISFVPSLTFLDQEMQPYNIAYICIISSIIL
jgi:hypothetical protein